VVGILRHGHRDREVHGVAPAGNEFRWSQGRLDALATSAAILLPLVADELKGPLDDVDLLSLLELILPFEKLPTTPGADLVRLIEPVDPFDNWERRLLVWTMSPLLPLLFCRGLLATGALLRGGGKQRSGAACQLLFE
jgi:hypothetical protein